MSSSKKDGELKTHAYYPTSKFQTDSAEHDIALIKLTHPLKLSDQVKLAALPSPTRTIDGQLRCFWLGLVMAEFW